MPSTPSFRFREALPIAMVVGVVAIGTVVGFRQAGATSVQEIRTAYGQIMSREDAPQLLLERLNRTNREDVAAEYLLLMATVGFRNNPGELLEPLVARQYHEGSTERSRVILTALRANLSPNRSGGDFRTEGYINIRLAETYPHDFAAQWLFVAQGYGLGTPAPERAKQAMIRAEVLTDKHPLAVMYRARFEEFANPESEQIESELKALHGLKLYEYARKHTGRGRDMSDSVTYITNWLRGRNVAPTEPSASEYLAVKRRGWGFTPQMIEPFRRVN